MNIRQLALLVAVLVAGVVVLQAYGRSRKIIRLPEDDYLAAAYDLRIDGHERVGSHTITTA